MQSSQKRLLFDDSYRYKSLKKLCMSMELMSKLQSLPKTVKLLTGKCFNMFHLKMHLNYYLKIQTPLMFAITIAKIAAYLRLFKSESKFMTIRPENAPIAKTICVKFLSNYRSQYKCKSEVIVKWSTTLLFVKYTECAFF